MDNLDQIINLRLKHHFYTNKETYLNFIKHHRKSFRAEYLLTKHFHFIHNRRLAKKFINKALKASKNSHYIKGIYYMYLKDNTSATSSFILCKGLNPYLDDEIDTYLRTIDPTHSIIKQKWNDIQLEFRDDKDKMGFYDLKVKEGNSFQIKLQNKIVRFIRKYNEMRIVKKQKVKQALNALLELKQFLSDNFIVSEYVNSVEKELKRVNEFFENVDLYRKGNLEVEEKVKNFETEIVDISGVRIKISETVVKRMVYEKMMKRFEVKENKIGMPFLPVFYDMAYDYVQYPSEESHVSKLLKGLSFFSRK